MENRRQLYYHVRHIYKQVQRIKIWQLIIVLILSGFITATFLRLNNIGMSQRRESVLSADREARDDDMMNRLFDLQRYSSAHMNADTGQFDLTEQYKRDVDKAVTEALSSANSNSRINAEVEAICRPRFSSTSMAYVQCFKDELEKYPSSPNPDEEVSLPSPALYRHSFASPLWSPDFAGFSLLFFMLVAFVILIRLLHLGFLYLLLKIRRSS